MAFTNSRTNCTVLTARPVVQGCQLRRVGKAETRPAAGPVKLIHCQLTKLPCYYGTHFGSDEQRFGEVQMPLWMQ